MPEPAAPTQLRLFDGEATELEPGGTKPSNRHPWAWLLQRVFAVEVMTCPRCRGAMKLVIFTSAHKLLTDLRAGRGDGTHERRLARYCGVDLLIIDDLGLRGLNGDEPLDLYEIIRQRYERGSTIITSNRALEEWAPLFKDALLASAAMDRLRHHAHVIEITGNSYRNPPPVRAA